MVSLLFRNYCAYNVIPCSFIVKSFYCSAACQKSSWKNHKIICGSVSQKEQALPSQTAIDKYLIETGKPIQALDLPEFDSIEEHLVNVANVLPTK